MILRRMGRFTNDERGVTLVEMLIVMICLAFVLGGIANVFVSGSHAQFVMENQIASQQDARVALSRLEYEAHCASAATIVGSGAGVVFTMPSQCVDATGTVTWCVTGGALQRFTVSGCSGTAQVFMRHVTSATPFSLATTTGYLPRLIVQLVTNEGSSTAQQFAANDTISLRNAAAS